MARTKSPKYPNYELAKAIENIRKIFDEDRTSALPREVIAKHLGYSGLSGASDSNIATLAQYGLLEKVGKGEMKVSQLAVDILLPEAEASKQLAMNRAALSPPLFSDIWNHFERRVPSDEALKTYLLRRDFNDRAVDPVMKSFAPTLAMLKQPIEIESGGDVQSDRIESRANQSIEEPPQMSGLELASVTVPIAAPVEQGPVDLDPSHNKPRFEYVDGRVRLGGGVIEDQAEAKRVIAFITAVMPMLNSGEGDDIDD